MSFGLQAEAGGSPGRLNASADLTGWRALHFTFESVLSKRRIDKIPALLWWNQYSLSWRLKNAMNATCGALEGF